MKRTLSITVPPAKKTRYSSKYGVKRRTLGSKAEPHPVSSRKPINISEIKFVDYSTANVSCKANPGPSEVIYNSTVAQGTQIGARLGQRCRLQALHIRGRIITTNTDNRSRIVGYFIVFDKAPNGTQATIQQMFNLNYTYMPAAFGDASFSQNGNRFTIIKKYQTVLGAFNASATGLNQVPIDHYIPIPKKCGLTIYDLGGTTGSIGQCVNGALYVVPFSDAVADFPTMDYASRLFIEDC